MTSGDLDGREAHGPIAYMARNGVAANLLMAFIVLLGLVSFTGLVQEAFPVLSFNAIEVSVPWPGATPAEVEESIVARIEQEVSGLDRVREVTSIAAEGMASVMVELRANTDMQRALDDVESAVGRIQGLPAAAERPLIQEMTNRQSVIRLVLHGDVPERTLKTLAFGVEDSLKSLPEVSFVETSGLRDDEISIEVPLRRLRALGLTLEDIGRAVREGSVDLSAGTLYAADAQVRVRTVGRSYTQHEFEDIVVLSRPDGTVVRLGDIAAVRDDLQDVDLITRFQGQRAAFVEVYRTANEQVLDIEAAVRGHVEREIAPYLPPGVGISIWNNDATAYRERLYLLVKNGRLGLLLVLIALALFLEIRLAFWVAAGIAICGVGALAALFATGVSVNVISLFAFVLAIGVVVDDAIVVAEQIHRERQRGTPGVAAAIRGTARVRTPLIFAVLTSVAAFFPLLFLPAGIGEVMAAVPVTMIAMLLLSLVESLLVLPNHLSHLPDPLRTPPNPVERGIRRVQAAVGRGVNRFREGPLDAALHAAVRNPGVTLCAATGAFIVAVSLIPAGIIGVTLAPPATGDIVTASLEMPEGTPAARTEALALELEAAGHRALAELSRNRPADAPPLLDGVNLTVGMQARQEGGGLAREPSLNPQSHLGAVEFKLLGAQERDVSADAFLALWREEAGPTPEARSLTFSAELLNLGRPIEFALSYAEPERLGAIGDAMVDRLRSIEGVFDVRSDHAGGYREVRLALKTEARTLGLTVDNLARQVRSMVFGEEALRVQRGREEVRVYVRLPADERNAIADIEGYLVRTPTGAEAPLDRVATVSLDSAPAVVRRRDGQRVVTVTADVDTAVIGGDAVMASLETGLLPELAEAHPGLAWTVGGQQQQQQAESLGALNRGFVIALLAIYALLAIPLGSYTRPLIVMAAIPFGIIGAILGHVILGINMDTTSIMECWGSPASS